MQQDRMQYRGVNHVALVARDMAETVDFYERVLEMPFVRFMAWQRLAFRQSVAEKNRELRAKAEREA